MFHLLFTRIYNKYFQIIIFDSENTKDQTHYFPIIYLNFKFYLFKYEDTFNRNNNPIILSI